MARKKTDQPVGGDIDWFVIPIERIRQWGILLLVVLVSGALGYFLYVRTRRSPEEKASIEIASAATLLSRATTVSGGARPGSSVAQARDLLRSAQESFRKNGFAEAVRLAVESQS